MKAAGIVRRINDLSRVVIPQEIRRTLRIREGPAAYNIDTDGTVLLLDAGVGKNNYRYRAKA